MTIALLPSNVNHKDGCDSEYSTTIDLPSRDPVQALSTHPSWSTTRKEVAVWLSSCCYREKGAGYALY